MGTLAPTHPGREKHGDVSADPLGEGKTVAKHAYFWQSLLHLREFIDRLDGRPIQSIDRNDLVTELSDGELLLIASGRGQTEDEMKLIPPPPKD
jgi:hypothetical protein